MQYSNEADREPLSSSSDDEDYVPSDEAEDDVNNEGDESESCSEAALNEASGREYSNAAESRKSTLKDNDEELRKKRADALFEAFLADTEEATTSLAPPIEARLPNVKDFKESAVVKWETKLSTPSNEDVFGETDKQLNDKTADKVSSNKANVVNVSCSTQMKRPVDGIGGALSLASKRLKMSVLDKSQKDWKEFKEEEGIEEDLTAHNRGRDGYLDKVEFLSRTDFRQFINERDARTLQRNKKL